MPRGNAGQTKIHYKGKEEDFIIFVDSAEDVNKWKEDSSIPLAQVVSGWKVFITHKHGNQGVLDGASNSALDNEFGTHDEEEVVKQIITKGNLQETEAAERQGDKNITSGPTIAH